MSHPHSSPLLGYNNNVRHKNRVFHIQTEDSGVKHPHVITHIFMDGGRILKSVKMSYAEHVGTPGMTEIVRAMMRDQHKAMFIELRDGRLDGLIEDHLARPSVRIAAVVPNKPTDSTMGSRMSIESMPAVKAFAKSNVLMPPLPPESKVAMVPHAPESASVAIRTVPTPAHGMRIPTQGSGRYAATRPAAIFAARPPLGAPTFVDQQLQDELLDDVILNYLAEDLTA